MIVFWRFFFLFFFFGITSVPLSLFHFSFLKYGIVSLFSLCNFTRDWPPLGCLFILKNRSLKASRNLCVCTFQHMGFIIEWPAGDPAILLGYFQPEVSVEFFLGPVSRNYGRWREGPLGDSAFRTKWPKGGGVSKDPCLDVHLSPLFQFGAVSCHPLSESLWLCFPIRCQDRGWAVSVPHGKGEETQAELLLRDL